MICYSYKNYIKHHFKPENTKTDIRRVLTFLLNKVGAHEIHLFTDLDLNYDIFNEINIEREKIKNGKPKLMIDNIYEFCYLLTHVHKPKTKDDFIKEIKDINNIMFFYFSGHIEIKKGERYLLFPGHEKMGFIKNDILNEIFKSSFNIIDACYSEDFLVNSICSCKKDQKGTFYKHGSLLTHYLIKYLNKAYINQDFDIKNLMLYLEKKMTNYCNKNNKHIQTPVCTLSILPFWIFDGEDNKVIEIIE